MERLSTSIWVYPWDLLDEGIGAALDAMIERAGATTLNVTAFYHAGKFLHVHNPKRRVVFPRSGTIYFPPRPGFDADIRIRPDVWDEAHGFWEELRNAADERELELAAWVVCLHNSGIGSRYPDCGVENAYGDRIPTDLCANHPDVRAFLIALLKGVAGLPVDEILLESLEYMPFRHGFHHEVIGVPTGPAVDFLMSLCFCEHCRGAARRRGLDLDVVRDWTRSTLDAHFADPYSSRVELEWDALREAAGGRFGALLDLRSDALHSLLAEIADAVDGSARPRLALIDFGPLYGLGPDGRRWENGVDLARQLPLVDSVHPTFYFTDQSVHLAKVEEYKSVLSGERPMVPAIRAILPQTDSEQRLLEQVEPLAANSAGFSFYNYGFMALQTLDWIGRVMKLVSAAPRGGAPPMPDA